MHDIRVACEKLRALLRLVRTKSKDTVLSREKACYRDAGRLLSEVRDTTAMPAALDKLIEHYSDQLARNAFDDWRKPFIMLCMLISSRNTCRVSSPAAESKHPALMRSVACAISGYIRSRKSCNERNTPVVSRSVYTPVCYLSSLISGAAVLRV